MENEKMLLFLIEDQLYGIAVKHVENVLNMVAIEWVNQSLGDRVGLINYHGNPIEIINLRAQFGFPIREEKPEDKLILVSYKAKRYALWIDAVCEVRHLDLEQMIMNPKFAQLGIDGIVAKDSGEMVMIVTALQKIVNGPNTFV